MRINIILDVAISCVCMSASASNTCSAWDRMTGVKNSSPLYFWALVCMRVLLKNAHTSTPYRRHSTNNNTAKSQHIANVFYRKINTASGQELKRYGSPYGSYTFPEFLNVSKSAPDETAFRCYHSHIPLERFTNGVHLRLSDLSLRACLYRDKWVYALRVRRRMLCSV